MKKTLLAVATAALMSTLPAAHAQRVVIDPTNLAQNLMTAANTLEQINNQIKQLQNQAQSLMNQAKNLTSLDFSALNELRAALSATNQLIQQAQGLAFNVQQMETQFQQLYPESFSATVSSGQMVLDARKRWTNSLDALRTATKVQSQAVQNFASDESTLTDLVNRSQSAVGALQATQATNQLLALQARQSIQAQQLQITQDRAAALEQARQIAVQERAREVRRRFTGAGTPYTPATVNFYSE
ncbi:P-type conjugative transfer protein TrbJ [Acidovorax sp. SUPP3434]|uniref:P-type conjugative transfer protein TrbJ n=1 Tax=Acidovorax sp. SUPP3434 TaxID=2920880 RepID=UPI0023DE4B6D|nr:P-type conjugative transfer protein TrbJ [Acidovorax sp. SUPP3434]GKT00459.1 P-type conjugative transfer protein TrbJ [Acidovorax sp. SUPP3434]